MREVEVSSRKSLPEEGSSSLATVGNHTLKKSHNSVIVPTVEREFRTELHCSTTIEGRMFSTASTLGRDIVSRN